MTAAYDPHTDWDHEDRDLEQRRRLLARIPGYFEQDDDPFAEDTWKEAS